MEKQKREREMRLRKQLDGMRRRSLCQRVNHEVSSRDLVKDRIEILKGAVGAVGGLALTGVSMFGLYMGVEYGNGGPGVGTFSNCVNISCAILGAYLFGMGKHYAAECRDQLEYDIALQKSGLMRVDVREKPTGFYPIEIAKEAVDRK